MHENNRRARGIINLITFIQLICISFSIVFPLSNFLILSSLSPSVTESSLYFWNANEKGSRIKFNKLYKYSKCNGIGWLIVKSCKAIETTHRVLFEYATFVYILQSNRDLLSSEITVFGSILLDISIGSDILIG